MVQDKLQAQKCYLPDDIVVNYMREKLHKEPKSGETPGNLRKRKIDALDRIFKSMANLTFFFECIANYPDIEDLFHDDIKDLLGVRRNDTYNQQYGFMLSNLLYNILIVKRTENGYNDFRLMLNEILQLIVWNKASETISDVFKTGAAKEAVSMDFDRVKAWMGMLAYSVGPEDNKPRRTFNFQTEELLK
ncbi:MAG: hypothetical protein ACJ72C_10145 [Nitrososphaeraceae archaeon]